MKQNRMLGAPYTFDHDQKSISMIHQTEKTNNLGDLDFMRKRNHFRKRMEYGDLQKQAGEDADNSQFLT